MFVSDSGAASGCICFVFLLCFVRKARRSRPRDRRLQRLCSASGRARGFLRAWRRRSHLRQLDVIFARDGFELLGELHHLYEVVGERRHAQVPKNKFSLPILTFMLPSGVVLVVAPVAV